MIGLFHGGTPVSAVHRGPNRLWSWRPDLLIAPGTPGLWLDPSDPARLSQDAAGMVPLQGPGQPVGRVPQRMGTTDALQSVSSARPTLARHPKGGRRNLTVKNDYGFVPVGVPLTSSVNSGGVQYMHVLGASGVQAVCTGTGLTDGGLPYVDLHVFGTNALVSPVDAGIRDYTLTPIGGTGVTVSAYVQVLAGSRRGLSFYMGGNIYAGASHSAGNEATYVLPSSPDPERRSISHTFTSGQNGIQYTSARIRVAAGATVDAIVRISGFQIERGTAPTPAQCVFGSNDITEPGVPPVWHLLFDGVDDSLLMTLPSGTYGLALVDLLGTVTFDTVTDPTRILPSGTMRIADALIRSGAFSIAEQATIAAFYREVLA